MSGATPSVLQPLPFYHLKYISSVPPSTAPVPIVSVRKWLVGNIIWHFVVCCLLYLCCLPSHLTSQYRQPLSLTLCVWPMLTDEKTMKIGQITLSKYLLCWGQVSLDEPIEDGWNIPNNEMETEAELHFTFSHLISVDAFIQSNLAKGIIHTFNHQGRSKPCKATANS